MKMKTNRFHNILTLATTINAAVVAPIMVISVIILVTNNKLSRKVAKNVSMISNAFQGIEPKEYVYSDNQGEC